MPHPKKRSKLKLQFPIFVYAFFALLFAGIIVYFTATLNPSFARFWNRYPGAFLRGALAYLTNIFPFSLSEIALMLLPVAAIIFIILIIKGYLDRIKSPLRFIVTIISIASLFLSLFTLGFGVGYHTPPLDQMLGINKSEVSKEDLSDTSLWLVSKINDEVENIEFEHQSFSVMPYSFGELNKKLNRSYDRLSDKYSFIPKLWSNAKPVILSEAMSYTHITGVYTYFSGEANVNINFPDYTIPFTTAHELAHQRGIAREDEANFIAFLVCAESGDPYIRYSGYLNLFEHMASPLSSYKDLYSTVINQLDIRVRYEMRAYSKFFEKYRDSTVGKVSETVNNSYLQSVGTQGTKSYGMVVDLAIAYLKDEISK